MSYHQMGSLASQTTLTGAYDTYGQSWNAKSKKSPRPRLPKTKSSPGGGLLSKADLQSEERSEQKKGKSTSATPTSPTFVPEYLLQTAGSILPTAHTDAPQPPKKKRSRTRIKPFHPKASDEEQTPIDLSRSAAENEGLSAIYRTSTDQNATFPIRTDSTSTHRHRGERSVGGYHHRTTSGTSQISSTPSTSSRYVHPMRQTPRPYTPPLANSYKTSLESDSTPPLGTPQAEPFDSTTTPTSYAPLPPNTSPATAMRRPKIPNPLHIRTGSAPRVASSSQTNLNPNLPGTPSSLRQHHVTMDVTSPLDNTLTSPISGTARSSLETASLRSRPFRSRSNTAQSQPPDPATQAATVAVLRQKFQEKEAKKDRKYAEAEAKSAEKESRRREKREMRERDVEIKNEARRQRKKQRSESRPGSEKSSIHNYGTGVLGTEVESNLSSSVPLPGSSYAPSVAMASTPPQPQTAAAGGGAGSGKSHSQYDPNASVPRLYPSRSRATSASRAQGPGSVPGPTYAHNYSDTTNFPAAQTSRKEKGLKSGKGEKVQSQWSVFWFRMRTLWLRFRRKMGGKGESG